MFVYRIVYGRTRRCRRGSRTQLTWRRPNANPLIDKGAVFQCDMEAADIQERHPDGRVAYTGTQVDAFTQPTKPSRKGRPGRSSKPWTAMDFGTTSPDQPVLRNTPSPSRACVSSLTVSAWLRDRLSRRAQVPIAVRRLRGNWSPCGRRFPTPRWTTSTEDGHHADGR